MFSPDLPITKSSEDALNRKTFAESLAKTLLQYHLPTSFTVGLYGKWGSGKTSLLNMVIENIEAMNSSAVILRFNPWLCSDPRQLIAQFFRQMSTAIKLKGSAAGRVSKLIDQYADILDAANAIPVAGAVISAAGKILLRKAKRRVERKTNDLQEGKDRIIHKMTEDKLKIIIAVDDIDRLSEEEIIAVFQLVKSLADFPNTIYILAFDYDVVIHALGRVQHGDGKEYLEKVIQVPFEIPAPDMENIHNILFTKLEAILGDIFKERWDKTAWAELFQFGLKKYIKSIRDVIRYTNVLSLKYGLLKDETETVDLLGITCLQVFEPGLYSRIPRYKDILCGGNSSGLYGRQNAEEEKLKKAIRELVTENGEIAAPEPAKAILGFLFPRIKAAAGLSFGIGRDYVHRNFMVNNNIAVPACFDRYFALALESDAIPTTKIRKLIYEDSTAAFAEGIMQIYQEGKIVRLLEELEAYASSESSKAVPAERAELIVKVLSRNWASFQVDDRESGKLFSIPFAWRILYCTEPLLKRMDAASGFSCIRSVFEDKDVQPSTLAWLLSDFETQHGRFTEREPVGDNALFSLEQVLELEQIFKKRAVDALDSGDALKQYKGLDFFWMLENIDPKLAAERKRTLVTDDISLVKVLDYCISRGTRVSKTVVKTYTMNMEALAEFIDVNEAYQRMKKYTEASEFLLLPQNDQINVLAFLLVEERKELSIEEESVRKELEKIMEK